MRGLWAEWQSEPKSLEELEKKVMENSFVLNAAAQHAFACPFPARQLTTSLSYLHQRQQKRELRRDSARSC